MTNVNPRWLSLLLTLVMVATPFQRALAQSDIPVVDPTARLIPVGDEDDTPVFSITDADRQPVHAHKPDGILPDGDPYWGGNLGSCSTATMDAFETDTHKHMSVVSCGNAWESTAGTFNAFPTSQLTTIRNRGTIPMFGWEPWQSAYGKTQPNFQLADIAGGRYDSYITSWATAAKAWGHPMFLKVGHEMNGNWYPWSEQVNGNSAGQFVTMWRHVHDIFTSIGASNVTWVWCPNIGGNTSTPLAELYPGDAYVDWTCLDGYNWAGVKKVPWQTITQVFRGGSVSKHDSYAEVLAFAPNKPMMIGETASSENGGSKAEWITSALTHELPTNMPQVKALIYFNRNADGADWPIETSASAANAFANGIAGGYWEPNVYSTITSIDPLMEGQPAPAQAQAAGTATLSPVADARVSQSNPSTNYGGEHELQANDGVSLTYMRFDLSTLAGHTLKTASLQLHTTAESWAGSAATFTVAATSGGWTETGLTYATRPASGATLGTIKQPGSPGTWYSIALDPAAMQKAVDGGEVDMVLVGASTLDTWAFGSRESGASTAPQLALSFQ